MDKKIIINFIYNSGYQILILILPFITIPYVSRIFSPSEIGIYSSTYSMSQMFLIIGMFAVGSFGVKEIAANRNNKENLSDKFYKIRYIQKITMTISIIVYLIIVFLFNNNRCIFFIQSINLLAGLFDISWLFMGLEDFGKTITRNIIVKLVSLILIFIFVKDSSDLWLYTFILSGSMLLGNLSMWVYKKNIILEKQKKYIYIKDDFISAFSLLIPQIAFQIYTSFDRSILGSVSHMEEVGMYDQSQKIIRMSVGIVTSLGIVMLPRITNMLSSNKSEYEIKRVLKQSLNITLFISLGCTFGIYSISKNFVPWFYGDRYMEVITLLKITALVCVLTALGSFFSNQYAIPKGNKKAYIIPLVAAAVVSIIFTSILGKKLGAIGASISIVMTEFIALLLRLFYLKKDLDYRYLFNDFYKFIISGIAMMISIAILEYIIEFKNPILVTLCEVFIGGIIYCIAVLILNKDYLIYIKKSIKKFI